MSAAFARGVPLRSRLGRFWWLVRRALVITYEENCLSISKGAAYSGLLALFPVITATATILVEAKARPVLQVLSQLLAEILPPGTENLVLNRFVVAGEKPALLLVLATLLALYAASGFMMSLMEGFNNVYHVPTGRPFLRQRAVAALLVFAAALPAIAASALILLGTRTERSVLRWGISESRPLTGGILLAGEIARVAVAVGAIALVTGLLYYLGPNRPQRWRQVWPGAWLATALWLAATTAFGWYARNIAGYNVLYGSVGAVIALLVWMYLLAVISCAGCAFNAAREQATSPGRR